MIGRSRSASRKRLNFVRGAVYLLLVMLVYLLVGWADAPGGDIALLTAAEQAEVVGRWYGR